MEHRHELEQILLNGLPAQERQHVVTTIRAHDSAKLRRLRAQQIDSRGGGFAAVALDSDDSGE